MPVCQSLYYSVAVATERISAGACGRFISSARAVGAQGFKIWWTEIQLPTPAALALGEYRTADVRVDTLLCISEILATGIRPHVTSE